MTGTRSTGCLTCRRRKVKCDEVRPSCRRCLKSSVECGGYQKSVVFIDDWKRRSTHSGSSSVAVNLMSFRQNTPTLGIQMSGRGIRSDQFISFFTSKLFSQRKSAKLQSWYAIRLKDLPTPGVALDALVTYFYGKYNQIEDIIREGVGYYTKALRRLSADLQSSEAYSSGTLITTVLLSMYELVGTTSSGGWIHHAGGLARLIESRGPNSHQKGIGKAVFLDQRTLIISEAVLQRKRTFLSDPEWKTKPWNDDPGSKTPFDYLLDIVADCAGLLHDDLQIDLFTSGDDIGAFVSRVHCSFDDLDAWWRSWATKIIDRVKEVPPNAHLGILYDDEGPVFETSIQYDDFWICYVTIVYDATRILLLQLLEQIKNAIGDKTIPMPERIVESSPLPLVGITNDMQALAFEILRASEFFESSSKYFLGAFCILFPFQTAQRCLVPGSRKARWLYSLPTRNMASYRAAAGDQTHGSALPVCGCMMIDSVVSNYKEKEILYPV